MIWTRWCGKLETLRVIDPNILRDLTMSAKWMNVLWICSLFDQRKEVVMIAKNHHSVSLTNAARDSTLSDWFLWWCHRRFTAAAMSRLFMFVSSAWSRKLINLILWRPCFPTASRRYHLLTSRLHLSGTVNLDASSSIVRSLNHLPYLIYNILMQRLDL